MRIAVIDLGTNSFNLLIVEVIGQNKFNILYNDKIAVKLGKAGINQGIIKSEAVTRALNAISNHSITIKEHKVEKVIGLATSAIRSARNGCELVEEISQEYKIPIRVIGGNEEAELIYQGVIQTLGNIGSNFLILDIGGGSNEFIIGNKSSIIWRKSYNLGMARLLDRFTPTDPITQSEIRKIEDLVNHELSDLAQAVNIYNPALLVGAAGTFDTFENLILAEKPGLSMDFTNSNFEIPLAEFELLHLKLIKSTFDERTRMKGMDPTRYEMIVLASIFVNFILKKFRFKRFIKSGFSLKEGALWKYLKEGVGG